MKGETMNNRVFTARKGAMFGNEKAQIYGDSLWKLKYQEGKLTPEMVVNNARAEKSPLHDFFEWEDTIAAEKYRKWQARHLIGSITTKVQFEDGSNGEVKAFHNVTVKFEEVKKEEPIDGYVTIQDVQNNEEYYNIVLEKAIGELRSWENKYKQYKKLKLFHSLTPVFKEIKKVGEQSDKPFFYFYQ